MIQAQTEASGQNGPADSPFFSIIIPAFNIEDEIGVCLQSISSQDFASLEILVVNDGSTDATLEIMRRHASQEPRLSVIDQPNGGPSNGRNSALSQARGHYILFVDGDDRLAPQACRRIFNHLQENPLTDVLVFDFYESKADHKQLIPCGLDLGAAKNSAWNKAFHHNLWQDERFPEDLWYEDLALIPALMYKAKFIDHLAEPLYYYSVGRPASIMSTVDASRFRNLLTAADLCVDRIHSYQRASKPTPDEALGSRWKRRFYTEQVAKAMLRQLRLIEDRDIRKQLINETCKHLVHDKRPLLKQLFPETGLRGIMAYLSYSRGFFFGGDLIWRVPGKLKRRFLK